MSEIADSRWHKREGRHPLTELLVLSDVHSNLEALEAVLKEARGLTAYCLGDLVGYGANPNEVIDLLRENNVASVMGNHDYAAVTAEVGMFNARAAMSAMWTTKQLTGKNLEYLRSLPKNVVFRVEDVDVYFAHGSPDDQLWEYVHPATHSQLFGHYLAKLEVGVVGLGHSHIPFIWSEGAGTVFNPGSVGQPRDGDKRASYAVVTVTGGAVAVKVKRVEYDYEKAASKIREAGLPEQNAKRLLTGN